VMPSVSVLLNLGDAYPVDAGPIRHERQRRGTP